MSEEDPKKTAKRYALQALSRRNYHSKELEKKLLEKNISVDVIPEVIENLKEVGVLNDDNAIESEINRGIRGLKGPTWLWYRLVQKGVAKEVLRDALEAFYPKEVRERVILEIFQKKGSKDRNSQIAAAIRAGFAVGEVLEMMRGTRS